MNILVTDGENRSSLAVTRSLGRKGHRLMVSGLTLRNISSMSRYCSARYEVADPMENENAFIQEIENIINKTATDIIVPVAEPSIRALLRNRGILPERIRIAAPPWEVMEKVLDKMILMEIARQNGVPIPLSVCIKNREDFFSQMHSAFSLPFDFPVVVKPSMSRVPTDRGYLHGGVMYAGSADELCAFYVREAVLDHPSMIQERIIGPGTAVFALFDRDRPLALFSHRRLREKPPSGGVSVLSESIPLDEEMVEASVRLLSAIGWTGVAMVEFKRDRIDGRPKLMEINGRFWGSLQLAIDCGVDFPALLIDYMLGNKPRKTIRDYTIGHRLKWLLGTFDHLLIRMFNRDERLNLPLGLPSRAGSFIDFLKICEKDTTFDVADTKDIMPFLWELREYVRHLM